MTNVWNVQPATTNGVFNPSQAWANHPQLRDFLVSHGAQDLFSYSPTNGELVNTDSGTVNLTNSQPLIDFIKLIQTVRRGDYFLTGEPPTHGAIVVGWGPLNDCGDVTDLENAMTPSDLVEGSNFASYGTDVKNLLVPYVTDANYAVQRGVYRHTQDPRPRPIYCLKAVTKNTLTYNDKPYSTLLSPSYFVATPWHFTVMPDTLHVPCDEQIDPTLPRP